MSNGFRRGLRGENRVWFVVGVSAWMLTRATRRRDGNVVYRTALQPGEQLVVVTKPAGHGQPSGD
jgi:hypothetical protein